MDATLVTFLIILAVLGGIPAMLTGSILKRNSKAEGGGGTDWVPLGFLFYGLGPFKHPKKLAIVWGYVFSNLVSWGAIVTLVILVWQRKR